MGYKIKTKIRIDLGDLGDNQGVPFFVEIKNPKTLPFDEIIKMGELNKATDVMEQIKLMAPFIRNLIVSWNLLDIDTEQPILSTDENSLNRIPNVAVTKIMETFKEVEADAEAKN